MNEFEKLKEENQTLRRKLNEVLAVNANQLKEIEYIFSRLDQREKVQFMAMVYDFADNHGIE